MQRKPWSTVAGTVLACMLVAAASPAGAQTPVFLDAPGSPGLPQSRLAGPDDPHLVVTHYARFNVLGIARQPGLLSLDEPGREQVLLTQQRFTPREGFDFLQPLPGIGPDELSYYWQGHALAASPTAWGSLDLYVTRGSLLGSLETIDGVFGLAGRWDEAMLRVRDDRLSGEIPYPPFEPREVDVLPALQLLPEGERHLPGETLVIRVSVVNHGPDASEGGVFIFDPTPLPGRLWIRPQEPLVREYYAHCHSLQFDVPGFPGEQVQRVTFGPLEPGETAYCDLPATVLSAAGGPIPVAGRWFPFPGTDPINDPVPGNEDAAAGVDVRPLAPVQVPATGWLALALLFGLLLGAGAVRAWARA